jgi:hypothetical protein
MTQPNLLALPELEQRTLVVEEIWPSDDEPARYFYRPDFAGNRWVCPQPPKPWASKEVAPGDAVLNREPTDAELDDAHDSDEGLFLRWWWYGAEPNDRLRRLATTPPDPSAKAYAALPDDDVAVLREEFELAVGWLLALMEVPSVYAHASACRADFGGLLDWWERVKLDRRERENAAREQRRNDLRRSALAKLSPEEAEALGVDWKGVGKAGDDQ